MPSRIRPVGEHSAPFKAVAEVYVGGWSPFEYWSTVATLLRQPRKSQS
jgi:hypothetical protein